MQVSETTNDGLKRGYEITITGDELAAKVDEKLAEAQPEIEMKGFRKGKVPMALLKKQFGPRLIGEAMQESVDGAMQSHLEETGDRPAMQPEVKMVNEDWKEGDDVEKAATAKASERRAVARLFVVQRRFLDLGEPLQARRLVEVAQKTCVEGRPPPEGTTSRRRGHREVRRARPSSRRKSSPSVRRDTILYSSKNSCSGLMSVGHSPPHTSSRSCLVMSHATEKCSQALFMSLFLGAPARHTSDA